MIDWLRLSMSNLAYSKELRSNPLFSDWMTFARTRSGIKVEMSEYRGMLFKVFPSGRIEITGSLHKYHNNGQHNVNDFSIYDLSLVINELADKLGSAILSAQVQNVEFGINIETPFTPSEFTDRIIVYLSKGVKFTQPITKDDSKGFQKGIKLILDNYQIKIYDKAGMYGQPGNILRCEYKTIKMESIKEAKVNFLSDLLKPTVIEFLFNRLLRSMDNILVNEVIDQKLLKAPEKLVYLQCINPGQWSGFTKDGRYNKKKQFASLISKYASTNLKGNVIDLLNEKYLQMIESKVETCDILTLPCKVRRPQSPLAMQLKHATF